MIKTKQFYDLMNISIALYIKKLIIIELDWGFLKVL